MDKHIIDVLQKIHIDEKLLELAFEAYQEKNRDILEYALETKKNIENQLNLAIQKQSKLLDSYLSNFVTEDAYNAKMSDLNKEKIVLEIQLENLKLDQDVAPESTLEPIKRVFLSANNAAFLYEDGDDFQKRHVLENLLWNLSVKDQRVASFQFKMPYQLIANRANLNDFSQVLPG